MVINHNGEVFEFKHPALLGSQTSLRVAEPFIVAIEFNQMRVIGKPSPDAKWLKNGDIIPRPLHSVIHEAEEEYVKIKCPTCDKLH